jgi:N-acetylneuraminic acid mutarotase
LFVGLGDNLLGPPGALKSVEYYDPESDTWTSLPDMYFARHSPAVAYVNNKLFVFGGGSPSPLLRPGIFSSLL